MSQPKSVIEPESVRANAPAPAPPVKPEPPIKPEVKPEFDPLDPEAVHPGEKPIWPNDYQTFARSPETPEKLSLKIGVFQFPGEIFSTSNRLLSAALLALDPPQGVRYIRPNPKEKPLCPLATKS